MRFQFSTNKPDIGMNFPYEDNRKDVVRSAYNLAKYIHKNKISDVILLDGSARPAYVPLLKTWKIMYENEKRPNIYFINPKAFKDARNDNDLRKLGKVFDNTFPRLAAKKKSNILIFDVCMHSGRTMVPVYISLLERGYSNLKTGLAQRGGSIFSNFEVDFEALDYHSSNDCTAFGEDFITRKPSNPLSILSKIDKDCSKAASSLRKELSSIVNAETIDFVKNEQPQSKKSKHELLIERFGKYLSTTPDESDIIFISMD